MFIYLLFWLSKV